jgi:O-antigen/teichoic acid export membrane protein
MFRFATSYCHLPARLIAGLVAREGRTALIQTSIGARGRNDAGASAVGRSRARRLFDGWSANLVLMLLGISQQVFLVPVFLHFWTSDTLAAWLAVYAAGNLMIVADAGLHARALNRFLAFKASVDCDGRTACLYDGMLWVYLGLVVALGVLLLIAPYFLPPSEMLGFRDTPHFGAAFVVMTVGALLLLPSNLPSALYRARGHYGRVVWLQSGGMLAAQLAQLLAIVVDGGLLAVAIAYVSMQVIVAGYLTIIDAPRLYPFLRRAPRGWPSWRWPSWRWRSWRWSIGQFRLAFPFAVAGATEIALVNAPVLLVSAFVSGRIAVAQWGLTRVIAGLVRTLCTQATLPLAAELGHDHAVGDTARLSELYARGSVFVTVLASLTVSGLLPFWPDFFALWTHGSVPYDPWLVITLLLGACAVAPSILALNFANYSNRGDLLVRTKGLQLVVFLVLSLALIPSMGPLGAAIAIVASDLLVQFGLLTFSILTATLRHPLRHIGLLALISTVVVVAGWGAGTAIRWLVPGTGATHFVIECALWSIAAAVVAGPLAIRRVRDALVAAIPR